MSNKFEYSIDDDHKKVLQEVFDIFNPRGDRLPRFDSGTMMVLRLGKQEGSLFVKLSTEGLVLRGGNKLEKELPPYGFLVGNSILDLLSDRSYSREYGYSFVKRYAEEGGRSEDEYKYVLENLKFVENRELYNNTNVRFEDLSSEVMSVDGIEALLEDIGDKVMEFIFTEYDDEVMIDTEKSYMDGVYEYLVG